MKTGLREVKIWNETMWVTVRATEDKYRHRIEPDEGTKFEVAATIEEELIFEITKELRRQFPHR